MAVILFEGPDNCGKTTIAKSLSFSLNVPYFKHNHMRRLDGGYDIYDKRNILINTLVSEYVLMTLHQINASAIVDRNYVSELVYAQLYRGMEVDDNQYRYLMQLDELFSRITDSLIVVCYKDNYKKKDDDIVNEDMYDKIVEKFISFTKASKAKCLLLNTTDEDLDSQIYQIKNALVC